MKICILLPILLYFCIISYLISNRDIMSLSVLLPASFLIAALSALYRYPFLQFTYSYDTILILSSCIILSCVIDWGIIGWFSGLKKPNRERMTRIAPMRLSALFLAAGVVLLTVALLVSEIRRIAGAGYSISETMTNYRMNNSWTTESEYQLPQSVKVLLVAIQCFGILFAFDLLYFWKRLSGKRKVCEMALLIICCTVPLMTAGRLNTINLLVGIVYLWFFSMHNGGFLPEDLIRNPTFFLEKNRGYHPLRLILKLGILGIVFIIVFYYSRTLVGRNDRSDLLMYVAHYVGDSLVSFDKYLHHPPQPSNIWGKETFFSLIGNLRKLKILDIEAYLVHKEFRYSGGFSLGNTYTALREYHHDFGIIGMYVLHIVFSVVFSFLHQLVRYLRIPLLAILFSTMYYCVLVYPIDNYFFSFVLSIGQIERIAIISTLYIIFYGRPLRLLSDR